MMDPLSFSLGAAVGAAGGAFAYLAERLLARWEVLGGDSLLPWGATLGPEADLIYLKYGGFCWVWELESADFETVDDGFLEALAARCAEALKSLPDGATVLFDAARMPGEGYPSTVRGGGVLGALDKVRREREGSGRFQTRVFLSVTLNMEDSSTSALREWAIEGGEEDVGGFERVVRETLQRREELAGRFGGDFKLRPLGRTELESYLRYVLTGRYQETSSADASVCLSEALAPEILTGFEPIVDGSEVRTFAVLSFPERLHVGMTREVCDFPFPVRWTVRWTAHSTEDGRKELKKRRNVWNQKRFNARRVIERKQHGIEAAAEDAYDDLEAAQNEYAVKALLAQDERWGECSLVLVCYCGAKEAYEAVEKLRSLGFRIEPERVGAVSAWRSSWPGDFSCALRRRLFSGRQIGRLAPITTQWSGRRRTDRETLAICSRSGGGRFDLGIYREDVGHSLILGSSGGGKTTFLQFMAAMFAARYENSRVRLLDYGSTTKILTEAVGGSFQELSPGGGVRLQPFANVDDRVEMDWVLGWLTMILEVRGHKPTAAQRRVMSNALKMLAGFDRNRRRMSTFLDQLQSRDLRLVFEEMGPDGTLGELLDGDEEPEASWWSSWEVETLLTGVSKEVAIPLVWYLIHRIERDCRDGVPTFLALDECWRLLADPRLGNRIAGWIASLRAKGVAMCLATQSPEQLGDSLSVITDQCPTVFFTASPRAMENRGTYEKVGLSEHEIRLIAGLESKREYFVRSDAGKAVIDLCLSESELRLYGTTEGRSLKEAQKAAQECRDHYGESWAEFWMRGL